MCSLCLHDHIFFNSTGITQLISNITREQEPPVRRILFLVTPRESIDDSAMLESLQEVPPATPVRTEVLENISSVRTERVFHCTLCMDVMQNVEVRRLQCGHEACRECMDRWLLENRSTCPLCRMDFAPEQQR